MKDQAVLRVRRRAAKLQGQTTPRSWKRLRKVGIVPVTLVVLITLIAGAFSFSQNKLAMLAPTNANVATERPFEGIDPNAKAADGLTDQEWANYHYSPDGEDTQQAWDRMIIRTAAVGLTVKDVLSSVERIGSLASLHGGYVFASESHEYGDYTYATVTIHVPAQEFDQIMPGLRKLDGQVEKVTNENVTSTDVTEGYTDLQSQLRNLQATETRLLDLQTKAETLTDVLAVDRELRTVQGDIERIQGRINYLDKRTSMSTITLELSPVAAPAPKPQSGWQPFEAAEEAWNGSLDMLGRVGTGLIMVSVFLWWAVPFALLAVWVVARVRRKPAAESRNA